MSQERRVRRSEAAGVGWLPAIPIQITAGVDTGYDDNVTLQPSGEGSIFTRENVVLTYDRPGEQTQFFVVGVGRFSQYFDVSGQNETAGNVTLSLTHNFSTSAFLLRQRLRHLPEPAQFPIQCWPGERGQPVLRHSGYFFAYLSLVFATFLGDKLHVRARSVLFLVERKFSERCSEHACSEPYSEHV